MKVTISTIAAAAMMLVGVPTVSVSPAAATSAVYCDGYARNYAGRRAGGNAIVGGLTGAFGGAILGGILGGNKGVGTGAAVGGIGGLAVGGSTWRKFYNQAYYDCINSGPVYREPVYLPPVGSRPWKQQCSQKYRSFNWQTGYYLGYDGEYHLCQLP